MRQRLLSATVENRSKREELAAGHADALARFDRHPAIAEITDALEAANGRKELPNPHVIRQVRKLLHGDDRGHRRAVAAVPSGSVGFSW